MNRLFRPATLLGVSLTALLLACNKDEPFNTQIPEKNDQPTTSTVEGNVFEPALVAATDQRIGQLRVPTGFTIAKFADGLGKPRQLAVSESGNVYVTNREAGTVTRLRDTNADGVVDEKQVVATIKSVHGITIHSGTMYLVAIKEVFSAPINGDGSLGTLRQLIGDLPDAGQHPNRTIGFGPDGLMYLTVGSTCNACAEPNPEHATMLVANPDGSNRRIYASGLRNTIGFGWHPQTKELYGFDHGIDWLGDEQQQEELNLIKQGAFYGWPYIYGDGNYNPHPRPMGDTTYAQIRARTTVPTLGYTPHAAPLAMTFYTAPSSATAAFPADYQNDAFVTMRGSWNRTKPSGYNVVRVKFENGKPVRIDDFVTGFLVENNQSQFGRPVGIATLPDGSLIFTDDNNGVIYRVSYRK
ncbi:glucose sorbosone dehydrogenase [Fibrella aestuarina BUZ 2]|uniref:Glucose sorbosone dehydrogenase n=1 Tax=Fibrella aestuarina BUZ 2 TaxID=1166018 RepID=I0K6D9_9BACT|nr:PQQ-dependent sugar dehydrogenase [Fibrella aestuarina]CCG99692.1 glucose sorbosone dehydrogenase [Fibrella aestuarina BUZ 2]